MGQQTTPQQEASMDQSHAEAQRPLPSPMQSQQPVMLQPIAPQQPMQQPQPMVLQQRPQSRLQNVKWRFLSDSALGRTAPKQPQFSDDAQRRVTKLETALASTDDLEAQYQSFLQEIKKLDPSGTVFDGVGPGWAGWVYGRAVVGRRRAREWSPRQVTNKVDTSTK